MNRKYMKKSLKIKFIAPDPHVMEVREKPRPASEFVPDLVEINASLF